MFSLRNRSFLKEIDFEPRELQCGRFSRCWPCSPSSS